MKIILKYKYLSYDVEQLLHKYSRFRIEDAEKRYEADMRVSDKNEGDLIRRLLLTGASRLRRRLAKYIRNNVVDAIDSLGDNTGWEYQFLDSVDADGQMLADLMHWMVVRYAISGWLRMIGAYAEADKEGAEADKLETDIVDAVNRIKMPMKEDKPQPIEESVYFYLGDGQG